MNKTYLFMVLSGILLVSSNASAATTDDTAGNKTAGYKAMVNATFNLLDCDTDGIIDPFEVDEHFSQLWLPVDRDHSRSLSKKEYFYTHRTVSKKVEDFLFRDADRNLDKKVSPEEFQRQMERAIGSLDSDQDGEVVRSDVGLKPMVIFRKPIKVQQERSGTADNVKALEK